MVNMIDLSDVCFLTHNMAISWRMVHGTRLEPSRYILCTALNSEN